MIAAVVLFWGSLAALAWTHGLYPLTVALAARVRTRRVALDDAYLPSVALIVTAYNEEAAIERRLENLRALDYPPELVELVVTSDASTDRTEELAEAAGAHVIRNPRGGKVAAQDAHRAFFFERLVARTDHGLARHLLGARDGVRNGAARDRQRVEVEQVLDLRHEARQAAGVVEVLHVVIARRFQVDQHRHIAAEPIETDAQAWGVVCAYMRRWQIEQRQCAGAKLFHLRNRFHLGTVTHPPRGTDPDRT